MYKPWTNQAIFFGETVAISKTNCKQKMSFAMVKLHHHALVVAPAINWKRREGESSEGRNFGPKRVVLYMRILQMTLDFW